MFGPTNRPWDVLENRRQLTTREEHSVGTTFGAAMPVAKVRQLAQHQSSSPQCESNVGLPRLWGDQPGPQTSTLWNDMIFSTIDCFFFRWNYLCHNPSVSDQIAKPAHHCARSQQRSPQDQESPPTLLLQRQELREWTVALTSLFLTARSSSKPSNNVSMQPGDATSTSSRCLLGSTSLPTLGRTKASSMWNPDHVVLPQRVPDGALRPPTRLENTTS